MDQFRLDRKWGIDAIGYPDPAIEILSPAFSRIHIPASAIERLWTGGRWLEGPVWAGDHRRLLFSDIPNDRILCWNELTGRTETFRAPSDFANGNTRDQQGRLLTCQQGTRSVTRTEPDGSVITLAQSFEGQRLNGPNDIVVHPDGSVWFTDPGYGLQSDYEGNPAPAELPTRIYSLNPETGELRIIDETFARPNGLCFSPDGRRLYVVDTGCTDDPSYSRMIQVVDISETGAPGRPQDFCSMAPSRGDGIRCDAAGNLWAASSFGGPGQDGVKVFSPEGEQLATIHLPEPCANLAFGGLKRNRVFMTAGQSLYSLYVEIRGAP